RRAPVSIAELAATPLVVREEGSGTRRTLDLALNEYERVAPLLELGSGAAVRTSVLGGMGPAVMSSLAVADDLGAGRVVEIAVDGLELERVLTAVWRPPRKLSGPAGELLRMITGGHVRERRRAPTPAAPTRAIPSSCARVSICPSTTAPARAAATGPSAMRIENTLFGMWRSARISRL